MTETRTRRTELDLCRITACIMVLFIHTGAEVFHRCPIDSPAFLPLLGISTAVRGSVPMFFMLSGALFLGREELELRPFLRHNVLRLAGLFLLWSLIYALGSRLAAGSLSLDYDFFYTVALGHYHMWFLPAMIMCYLFMPPVHAAIHGRRLGPRYLLFLFFTVTLLCANCNLTPDPAYILNRLTLHFDMGYLGYLGYAVWGYWLSTKRFSRRWLWLAPLIFALCTLLTTLGNRWYSGYKEIADGWLFSYFSLPSFIQASSCFVFFLALRGRGFRLAGAIRALADCTLGVYLMHPLMINLLERLGLTVGVERPALSLLWFTALLAAVCFAVTALIKRIPGARKLL